MTVSARAACLIALLCLSACDSITVPQPALAPLTSAEISSGRDVAEPWLGDGAALHYVCGQSDGVGLFTAKWKGGFQPDRMKGGLLLMITRRDGRPDLIFRDATGAVISAVDDTGSVVRYHSSAFETWTIG